jgi:hypothetical protein
MHLNHSTIFFFIPNLAFNRKTRCEHLFGPRGKAYGQTCYIGQWRCAPRRHLLGRLLKRPPSCLCGLLDGGIQHHGDGRCVAMVWQLVRWWRWWHAMFGPHPKLLKRPVHVHGFLWCVCCVIQDLELLWRCSGCDDANVNLRYINRM